MLTFEPEGHRYLVDGVQIPSVTQILGRVGVRRDEKAPFRSISGDEFIDDPIAAKFGREFHKTSELILNGKHARFDPQMQPWVDSWNTWRLEHADLETIMHDSRLMVEWRSYSRVHWYALTLDWACWDAGKPVITDWKTSETRSEVWWLQLAAYAAAAQEVTGIRGWQTRFVQVLPSPQRCVVETHDADQVRLDWNRFLSIVNTYKMAA